MLAARRAHLGKKEDGTFNEVGEVNTSGRENRHTKARKQETALALAPAHVGESKEEPLPGLVCHHHLGGSGILWGHWELVCHFGKKNVFLSVLL